MKLTNLVSNSSFLCAAGLMGLVIFPSFVLAEEGEGEAGELDKQIEEVLDAQEALETIRDEVNAFLPLNEASISREQVQQAIDFLQGQGQQAREYSQLLGLDPYRTMMVEDEDFLIHDFIVMDYPEFLDREADIFRDATDGAFSDGRDYHLHHADLLATAIASGNPDQIAFAEEAYALALDNTVLWKIMAAFGLSKDIRQGFAEAVNKVAGSELRRLGRALDKGQRGKALKLAKAILNKLRGKAFRRALANKIGARAAGKVLAKIGARWIPWIGWGLFGVSLIWEIGEQLFD